MPRTQPLSIRLGAQGADALDELARRRRVSRSEAARQAIVETAARERRRHGLAAEARALTGDQAYVAEARAVMSTRSGSAAAASMFSVAAGTP
jgi:Arc/MetJ-type ribon-helix-helix transcriptional regulator